MLGPKAPNPELQSDAPAAGTINDVELQLGMDEGFARRFAAQEHGLPDPAENMGSFDRRLRAGTQLACPICLESMLDTTHFKSDCGHLFCEPCIRQHITHVATETKTYPITCPSCREELDSQRCLSLLAGTGAAHEALENLILERQYFSRIRYCAEPSCANPFDWVEDPGILGFIDEFKVTCPLCQTATCVKCKVKWHENQTCEQYAVEKENTDALVQLARQNEWRECPSCGHIIERRMGDCNFVKCRCGCGFCHKCGIEYPSLVSTTHNQHGQAGCTCGLFGADFAPPVEHVRVVPGQIFVRPPHALLAHQPYVRYHRYPPVAPAPGYQPYNNIENGPGNPRNGPNGYIEVERWVTGVRRRRLPVQMESDLLNATCPYNECKTVFLSTRHLEQHLVDVQWHPVWLCCGRPFYTERGRNMHADALHEGQVQ